MSSQDYLKQAAAMLRRAAMARKLEVDELRHTIDLRDQERRHQLNEKEKERVEKLTEAAVTNDDGIRAEDERRAHNISLEKSLIEKEYIDQKKQLDQQLQNMQKSVDDYNRMAQGLEQIK